LLKNQAVPRLINRHPLDNGLTLEFWDYSRPVAGDRWYAVLEARIVIPVNPDTLPPELQPQAPQVLAALGNELIFSQRDERNFIADAALANLRQAMQERLLALAPGYFGHADFAARFIGKSYALYQERQPLQGAAPGRQDDT
jgi:hypothetical protein